MGQTIQQRQDKLWERCKKQSPELFLSESRKPKIQGEEKMEITKQAYPNFQGIYKSIFVCPKCGGDAMPTNHYVSEVGRLWYCFGCETYFNSELEPQPKPLA